MSRPLLRLSSAWLEIKIIKNAEVSATVVLQVAVALPLLLPKNAETTKEAVVAKDAASSALITAPILLVSKLPHHFKSPIFSQHPQVG